LASFHPISSGKIKFPDSGIMELDAQQVENVFVRGIVNLECRILNFDYPPGRDKLSGAPKSKFKIRQSKLST
jgi:hypothetical protein